MNSLKMSLALLGLTSLMMGCGSDKTRYVDVITEVPVEHPVEYMPVDGYVLGFWVMDQEEACDGFCVNDYSAYGNLLHAQSPDYSEPDSVPIGTESGEIGQVLGFNGAYQLSTGPDSVLANTVIGERFTLHVRARSQSEELGSVVSLGSQRGQALDLQMNGDTAVLHLPNQDRRLVIGLPETDWQELWISSDGDQLQVQLGCETVAGFDRAMGQPMLSRGTTGIMVGAGWGSVAQTPFQGEVDLARLSRQDEANLFCNQP